MKKKFSIKIILSSLAVFISVSLFAWGIWGHEHINHAAVFALPKEMRSFFYNHIDFITEESSVPDLRKYEIGDKAEFARHYIDIESYDKDNNFDNIPKTMKEAVAKYDSAFMQKNGILPWYVQDIMVKLTKAFKTKQKTEILFLAADLAHYLGDANMPLHTSLNHDGQYTNQKGIHAFWESQLPELFGYNYDFHVDDAKYITDVTTETWNIIKHSHQLADTLLLVERNLKDSFPKEKIYNTDDKGNIIKNEFGQAQHSYAYAEGYNKALNGMVERQMRNAIQDVSNFWYTAWVNAGKPDLNDLDPSSLTQQNSKQLKKDYRLYQQGKLNGFKATNEFNQ
jgi:hypothetical protein